MNRYVVSVDTFRSDVESDILAGLQFCSHANERMSLESECHQSSFAGKSHNYSNSRCHYFYLFNLTISTRPLFTTLLALSKMQMRLSSRLAAVLVW